MVFSCPYNSMLDTTVMDRRFTATTNKQSDANLSNSTHWKLFSYRSCKKDLCYSLKCDREICAFSEKNFSYGVHRLVMLYIVRITCYAFCRYFVSWIRQNGVKKITILHPNSAVILWHISGLESQRLRSFGMLWIRISDLRPSLDRS